MLVLDGTRHVTSPSISVPRSEALRLLGIGRGKRPPRPSLQKIFDEEYENAVELVQPQAVARYCSDGLPGCPFVEPGIPVAIAVCTIGSALEARVESMAAADNATRALVLDALGSAAAEAVADAMNAQVCQAAHAHGLHTGKRRSPGYGRWELQEQRTLFSLLGPEDIGMGLTERCMMLPRKSVSFVVPLLQRGEAGASRGRCHDCDMTECGYRVTLCQ